MTAFLLANERSFAFHPASLSLILSTRKAKSLGEDLVCDRGTPKYFPRSFVVLMPKKEEIRSCLEGSVFLEKETGFFKTYGEPRFQTEIFQYGFYLRNGSIATAREQDYIICKHAMRNC